VCSKPQCIPIFRTKVGPSAVGPLRDSLESVVAHEPGASGLGAGPRICVIALTDRGLKRRNNEDNILLFDLYRQTRHAAGVDVALDVAPPGALLAVADGMGGHQAGQVASALCVENLPKAFQAAYERQNTGVNGVVPAFKEAVEATNQLIFEAASSNPHQEGMGTTLTAALLNGKRVSIAQVGDSRAYLLSARGLQQLTEDQTVGNLLADQLGGEADSRLLDLLVQALGAQAGVDVALTEGTLEPGDCLLLCSDGLYKVVPDVEIAGTLGRTASLKEKAEALIHRANDNGGPDNITVVLAEIESSRA
jgi:PPM family protein phosphatase